MIRTICNRANHGIKFLSIINHFHNIFIYSLYKKNKETFHSKKKNLPNIKTKQQNVIFMSV